MLELGFLILSILAWNLEFGILVLEFGSLGVRVMDSVMGFVMWFLLFGILEFGFSSLVFWYSLWSS